MTLLPSVIQRSINFQVHDLAAMRQIMAGQILSCCGAWETRERVTGRMLCRRCFACIRTEPGQHLLKSSQTHSLTTVVQDVLFYCLLKFGR